MPKAHINEGLHSAEAFLLELLAEFNHLLNVPWQLPADLRDLAIDFIHGVGRQFFVSPAERGRSIIPIINAKFRLNKLRLQEFYNRAARRRVYFDPGTKERLSVFFDHSDAVGFDGWASLRRLPAELRIHFAPVTSEDTMAALQRQMQDAIIRRSDARLGVQAERRESILRALFGSWLFEIVDRKHAFAFTSGLPVEVVEDTYSEHLRRRCPEVLHRSCGGIFVRISARQLQSLLTGALRALLFDEVKNAYHELSNHSYLGLLIDFPDGGNQVGKVWEIVHDATVYAERCHSTRLRAGFFSPAKIRTDTVAHITAIDPVRADFDVYQHGFAFRDCVVICSNHISPEVPHSGIQSALLLFEKHVADETAIPCPACRSMDVRGNSYPVLGVKSWECQNALCPERSAFDRGNRFSLAGILRGEASRDSGALIPEESLRDWKLDVVGPRSDDEVLTMFIRHYSLPDDCVTLVNWTGSQPRGFGRRIIRKDSGICEASSPDPMPDFEQTAFFQRYLRAPSQWRGGPWKTMDSGRTWLELYQGSCLDVLAQMAPSSIDGAVTSPPYYNAREYSSWPNIYCYLFDMKLAAEAVQRVLKPGGYYLFNIFDYFDNDNIVAFSSMGKRRLPLGAYLSQIFRASGFEIAGNVIWYKGEIEGKRNYNQGNRAPFFQLPLNAWEHILVLRKPGSELEPRVFPSVVFYRSVFKWVNGENKHGHSAPFPIHIPDLLCARMPRGSRILDPFAGSLTTALACHRRGQQCVAVELHEAYCLLGLEKIAQLDQQLTLFPELAAGSASGVTHSSAA